MSSRVELMLLLDKTTLESQHFVKFRNKKFGGRVWGNLCGTFLGKAVVSYISIFQSTVSSCASSYPCLSLFPPFDAGNLCLPLCFSVLPGRQASCDCIPNPVVPSPCLLPLQMLKWLERHQFFRPELSLLVLGRKFAIWFIMSVPSLLTKTTSFPACCFDLL